MQIRLVTFVSHRALGAAALRPASFAGDPAPAAGAESVSQTELSRDSSARTRIWWCWTCARPPNSPRRHVPGARNVPHAGDHCDAHKQWCYLQRPSR